MPTAVANVTAQQPAESGNLVKVKVKLRRDQTGYYKAILLDGQTLPQLKQIISFLTTAKQRIANSFYQNYYDLHTMISMCGKSIKIQDWCDAIAKAIAHNISDKPDAETELLTIGDSGYMSFGNVVFKLQPVDHVVARQKALPVMRRRVMEDSKQAGERIVAEHVKRGEEMLNAAREQVTRVNRERQQLQREVDALASQLNLRIPTWGTHIPFRYDQFNNRMEIGFWISYVMTKWHLPHRNKEGQSVILEWNCAPKDPENLLFWHPYGPTQNYHARHFRIDEWMGCLLPHTSTDHSCLEIGDLPKQLTNMIEYNQMKSAFARAIEVYNLGSPLQSYMSWGPRIQKFLPPTLDKIHDHYTTIHNAITKGTLKADNIIEKKPVLFTTPDTETTGETVAAMYPQTSPTE